MRTRLFASVSTGPPRRPQSATLVSNTFHTATTSRGHRSLMNVATGVFGAGIQFGLGFTSQTVEGAPAN